MIRAFFSALSFLTVIPVPESWKSRRENGMFTGYPAVGLLIGLLLAGVLAGAHFLFPGLVAAGILVAASLLLTGAIHLDGLADCADAFYGKRDRQTVLRILKDPRIGTMGGAAIGISLLIRTAAFASLPFGVVVLALPAASLLSRAAVLVGMRALAYVRGGSGIISARIPIGPAFIVSAAVGILIAAAALPLPSAVALAAVGLFWRLSWKKIGGCTGDVLGASIEIAELAFLLALAAETKARLQWGGLFPLLRILFPVTG